MLQVQGPHFENHCPRVQMVIGDKLRMILLSTMRMPCTSSLNQSFQPSSEVTVQSLSLERRDEETNIGGLETCPL